MSLGSKFKILYNYKFGFLHKKLVTNKMYFLPMPFFDKTWHIYVKVYLKYFTTLFKTNM